MPQRKMSDKEPLLSVRNLHARVAGQEILRGVDLEVRPGEVHAIMGPNGSGKSTLANVLAGRPEYEVTQGQVLYQGEDLLALEPEERARRGLFLAFQYPVELPGVRSWQFLKAAMDARRRHRGEEEMGAREFDRLLKEKVEMVEIGQDLVRRAVNEGFSGGEKKRNEVLQMALLEPTLALLDETDSGLDIDALANRVQRRQPVEDTGQRHGGGHSLSAHPGLHYSGPGARSAGRAHCRVRGR